MTILRRSRAHKPGTDGKHQDPELCSQVAKRLIRSLCFLLRSMTTHLSFHTPEFKAPRSDTPPLFHSTQRLDGAGNSLKGTSGARWWEQGL